MIETTNGFKVADDLDQIAGMIRRKVRRVRKARDPDHRAEGLDEIEAEAHRMEVLAERLRG